jgi:hypothetical protein
MFYGCCRATLHRMLPADGISSGSVRSAADSEAEPLGDEAGAR